MHAVCTALGLGCMPCPHYLRPWMCRAGHGWSNVRNPKDDKNGAARDGSQHEDKERVSCVSCVVAWYACALCVWTNHCQQPMLLTSIAQGNLSVGRCVYPAFMFVSLLCGPQLHTYFALLGRAGCLQVQHVSNPCSVLQSLDTFSYVSSG